MAFTKSEKRHSNAMVHPWAIRQGLWWRNNLQVSISSASIGIELGNALYHQHVPPNTLFVLDTIKIHFLYHKNFTFEYLN